MTHARPQGSMSAKRSESVPFPEPSRYQFRQDMVPVATPRGRAVAYSTDDPDTYAPFRGEPACVSRTGYARRAHDFDQDGRCFWCEARIST